MFASLFDALLFSLIVGYVLFLHKKTQWPWQCGAVHTVHPVQQRPHLYKHLKEAAVFQTEIERGWEKKSAFTSWDKLCGQEFPSPIRIPER